MKPEENWPDALAGAVIQTAADFLEARGLAKCESNVLDAAMAIVFAGLEIGRNNGVSRARLFEAGIRLLANRTGAEVVCAPLPTSAAASGRKPS